MSKGAAFIMIFFIYVYVYMHVLIYLCNYVSMNLCMY